MTEMEPLYKKGESVWPSSTNRFKFNKNAKFPWKVHRQEGLTLYVEHPSRTGKKVIESWFVGFWQDHPVAEEKEIGKPKQHRKAN